MGITRLKEVRKDWDCSLDVKCPFIQGRTLKAPKPGAAQPINFEWPNKAARAGDSAHGRAHQNPKEAKEPCQSGQVERVDVNMSEFWL